MPGFLMLLLERFFKFGKTYKYEVNFEIFSNSVIDNFVKLL